MDNSGMLMPKPAIGRVVHYVSFGTPGGEYTKQCRAATITGVGAWITTDTQLSGDEKQKTLTQEWNPIAVSLHVANPSGQFFNSYVLYDPGYPETVDHSMCDGLRHNGGTYHWPALTKE